MFLFCQRIYWAILSQLAHSNCISCTILWCRLSWLLTGTIQPSYFRLQRLSCKDVNLQRANFIYISHGRESLKWQEPRLSVFDCPTQLTLVVTCIYLSVELNWSITIADYGGQELYSIGWTEDFPKLYISTKFQLIFTCLRVLRILNVWPLLHTNYPGNATLLAWVSSHDHRYCQPTKQLGWKWTVLI